ncbi:hypothetical protein BO99DRAFT_428252 [Aspergillus violaceofuscus CBS 115571]|uniref:Uncharacterized protein n=1 Tax=Aspergillus violaceofuscus (strain CBS 115571) TaxID=1450538 RepID=A0A2V5HHV5_ASPV1|nr:hypothetical protein BO99DRAFT_428252 [Aspergillus violaceofuscus CBS 115571]
MTDWLNSLYPVYGDHENEKPSNTIPVVDDKNGDINAGFGGKYVWLVANYIRDPQNCLHNIKIVVSDTEKPGQMDLTKKAGGQYRYLETSTVAAEGFGISNLKLLRSTDEVSSTDLRGLGYRGWTADINAGRGGDYLYLVWRNG